MHIHPLTKRAPMAARNLEEILDIIAFILNIIAQANNVFSGLFNKASTGR